MERKTIMVGVCNYIDIKLLETFDRNNSEPIICIVNEKEKNYILQTINTNNVCFIDLEKLDIEKICSECKGFFVDLWLSNGICFFKNVQYKNEIINYHTKTINKTARLLLRLNISTIHYISSIYTPIEETKNLYFEINKLYERFLRTTPKADIKIYRLPNMFEITNELQDNFICRYSACFLNFYEWINSRVARYFDNNVLRIKANEKKELFYVPIDVAINKIFELSLQKTSGYLEYIIVSNLCLSEKELIQLINKNTENINIQFETDIQNYNVIDRMFLSILYSHVPSIDSFFFSKKAFVNCIEVSLEFDENEIKKYIQKYIHLIHENDSKKILKNNVVTVGEKKLTYYTAGSGEPLVIINAYGISVNAWEDIIAKLSKFRRIIVWETRGIINEEKSVDSQSYIMGLIEQVKDIEAIIEHEQISKCDIISWCSGVKSALVYGCQNASKIGSQIFIAGEYAPYTNSKKDHSKFRENIQLIAELINGDEKMLSIYMKIINNGMFNRPLQENISSEDLSHIFEILPAKHREILLAPFSCKEKMVNFLNMCMEYYSHDVTDYLSQINVPLLFISAECDQVAPNAQTKWAHSISNNSKHITIMQATHLLILERTEELFWLLRDHHFFCNIADD